MTLNFIVDLYSKFFDEFISKDNILIQNTYFFGKNIPIGFNVEPPLLLVKVF